MQGLFNIINIPLGYIMRFLADFLGGNFAAAVFAFTLIINLALIPLSIKSQKSAVQQARIKPKLDDLKKRYGDDKQKYSEAMQKLYQEENVSMSGGCLPMFIRLAIMMSIYWLIMSPLTYMAGVDKAQVKTVNTAITEGMEDLKKENPDKYEEINKKITWSASNSNNQLGIVKVIRECPEVVEEILSKKEYNKIKDDLDDIIKTDAKTNISYDLLGIDLTQTPHFSFNIFKDAQPIWLIPICAFLAQMLTSIISMFIQKRDNPDAPNMAGMMLTMPLISLFIGFTLPGGVGFYWICSSLVGGLMQPVLQTVYGPNKMLAKERVKELTTRADFEEKHRNNAAQRTGGAQE